MGLYTPIVVARFWSKVEVGANSECWLWKGAVGGNGYGRFKLTSYETEQPHRVAWELANGEPLGPRFGCHHCDTPLCVNPHHLYAGDVRTNAGDAVARNRSRGNRMDQGGEKNPNARLCEADVARIKQRIDAGEKDETIALDYPVGSAMIWRIRRGLSWAGVPSPRSQGGGE